MSASAQSAGGASPLQGKLVCVTGASSGIGRSSARLFAQQGARLLLAARRTPPTRPAGSILGCAHTCATTRSGRPLWSHNASPCVWCAPSTRPCLPGSIATARCALPRCANSSVRGASRPAWRNCSLPLWASSNAATPSRRHSSPRGSGPGAPRRRAPYAHPGSCSTGSATAARFPHRRSSGRSAGQGAAGAALGAARSGTKGSRSRRPRRPGKGRARTRGRRRSPGTRRVRAVARKR